MRVNKALEIKTSIVFSLTFASNTILSCFFLFFDNGLILISSYSYFKSCTAELVISTGTPTNGVKVEI